MTQYMQEAGAMKQADDEQREAFENAMRKWHPEWAFTADPVFDYHNERTRCAWEGWQAALAAALPPAAVQAWIPVSERLPDEEVPVMVFTPAMDGDEERIDFDFRYEGGWHNHNDCYDHFMAVGGSNAVPGEVCTGPDSEAPYTHWMPIPSSPLAANEGTLTAGKQGGAGVAGTHPMRDGYTGSVLDSAPNGHKLTAYYATREQADAAQAWLAAGVPAGESAALTQVLDALRIGKVACEWAGENAMAQQVAEAYDAARALAGVALPAARLTAAQQQCLAEILQNAYDAGGNDQRSGEHRRTFGKSQLPHMVSIMNDADRLAAACGVALDDPADKLRRCTLGCFDYGQCKANMHGVPSECASRGVKESGDADHE